MGNASSDGDLHALVLEGEQTVHYRRPHDAHDRYKPTHPLPLTSGLWVRTPVDTDTRAAGPGSIIETLGGNLDALFLIIAPGRARILRHHREGGWCLLHQISLDVAVHPLACLVPRPGYKDFEPLFCIPRLVEKLRLLTDSTSGDGLKSWRRTACILTNREPAGVRNLQVRMHIPVSVTKARRGSDEAVEMISILSVASIISGGWMVLHWSKNPTTECFGPSSVPLAYTEFMPL